MPKLILFQVQYSFFSQNSAENYKVVPAVDRLEFSSFLYILVYKLVNSVMIFVITSKLQLNLALTLGLLSCEIRSLFLSVCAKGCLSDKENYIVNRWFFGAQFLNLWGHILVAKKRPLLLLVPTGTCTYFIYSQFKTNQCLCTSTVEYLQMYCTCTVQNQFKKTWMKPENRCLKIM